MSIRCPITPSTSLGSSEWAKSSANQEGKQSSILILILLRFNKILELTSMPPEEGMYYEEMRSYYSPNKMTSKLGDFSRYSGSVGRATSTQFIMPYVKHNRDYRDHKNLGLYINDGTSLNPSDPNSMRDQGQARNAPYNIHHLAYNTINRDNSASALSKTTYATSWKGFPASVDARTTTAYVSGNIKNRDI